MIKMTRMAVVIGLMAALTVAGFAIGTHSSSGILVLAIAAIGIFSLSVFQSLTK